MRIELLTLLFYGTLLWMVFDFLFFAGLFVNYIHYYGIPIFFNQFFIDNQWWWLWPLAILFCGSLFLIQNKVKLKIFFYLFAFFVSVLAWIPSFGQEIGYTLFAKEGVRYRFRKIEVENVILLYKGRGYEYVRLPQGMKTLRYPSSARLR